MKKLLVLISLFTIAVLTANCRQPETAPMVAVPTIPQSNFTCNNISLYLNSALGDRLNCETVPENTTSVNSTYYPLIYPAHIELTILNYPLSQTQFPPRIWIYPISRFNALLPDILPNRVTGLENIVAGESWEGKVIPFLPLVLEQQYFVSHGKLMSFTGGDGIRFITDFGDGPNPISNMSLIYTFQGLTDDGKYWLAVTLPVSNPILPETYDILPEGYTEENLAQNYEAYISSVKNALEVQPMDSFYPAIDLLDNLITSLIVNQ